MKRTIKGRWTVGLLALLLLTTCCLSGCGGNGSQGGQKTEAFIEAVTPESVRYRPPRRDSGTKAERA